MSITPTKEDLERRLSQWSTEELIEAVALKTEEYMPSAIEVMRSLLQSRGVPESDVQSVQSNLGMGQEDEATRLGRVRGWLLVFVLVVALNALVQLVMAADLTLAVSSLSTSWMALPLGAAGIYGEYVALLLVRRQPRAPVHAQRWLVLTLLINVISAALVYVTVGSVHARFVFSVIHVTLWLSYVQQSKRVASVYGISG